MNILGVNFSKEAGNIGDIMCGALDYFPTDFGTARKDLRSQIEELMGQHLIFGGGGLFHTGSEVKMAWLERLSRVCNPKMRLVVWGAGLNHHDTTAQNYPDFLKRFDLVGMRDWQNPYEYVPCPSCMHWGFKTAMMTPVSNPVVVFQHHATPIDIDPTLPRITNGKQKSEFLAVLQFLASGDCVVTNSFHGAYWGLLLGRKVVIYKPFSNRFIGFKPKVEYCDEKNWKERVAVAENHPWYLDECVDINRKFALKVASLLRSDVIPETVVAEEVKVLG